MKSLQENLFSVTAGVFLFLVILAPGLRAEGGADYSVGISQKFGRGLMNVLSSPLEIPCGIRDEVGERGGAGIGSGFFKGTGLFLRRLLVGLTEAATFVIPMEATLPSVCSQKPKPRVESGTVT